MSKNKEQVMKKELRNRKSVRFTEYELTDEFQEFVDAKVWPACEGLHPGYKEAAKKALLAQCAHAAISAGLTGQVVADDRGHHVPPMRIQVWDALCSAGFCISAKGSEVSGKTTRYLAQGKLLSLRKEWKLALLEKPGLQTMSEDEDRMDLIVLKTGDTDWVTGRELPEDQKHAHVPLKKEYHRAFGDPLDGYDANENLLIQINEMNLRHGWRAWAILDKPNGRKPVRVCFQINPAIRQIHSREPHRASRLYTVGRMGGQNLSKALRRSIEIDGSKAAEIDSIAHAIRLTYHMSRLDPDLDDLYQWEQVFPRYAARELRIEEEDLILRTLVKTATNICLNTDSRANATRAIRYAVRNDTERRWLYKQVDNEGDGFDGLLNRLIASHPKVVQDRFFCEFGLFIMRVDGDIMKHTLKRFVVDEEKPALPIHDSLVIRAEDVHQAHKAYAETYAKFTRKMPVMRREF
jgi:hypothetical protein